MSMSKSEARASLLYTHPPVFDRDYTTYSGGYASREGLAPQAPISYETRSWWYLPNTKWTWAFLLVVLAQALAGLGLESYIFGKFQISVDGHKTNNETSHSIPSISAYLSLFIFGFVYQVLLTYDALRMKNTIQIIGLCLYNIGLLIEAAVQLDQIGDAVNALSKEDAITRDFWTGIRGFIVAVPCVLGLGTVLMAFVTWKLYGEFSWSIYKNISADLRLKRRFLSYQIYIALLKFDFFFFLAFTVQFLVVVSDTTDVEFYLTIVAIPITLVILLCAALVTRRESVWGMVCVIIIYFAGLAYFLFKLVRIYASDPARIRDYMPARNSLTTFAVITVLLLFITIAYAIICTVNFNKGLKQHIQSHRRKRRQGSQDMDKLYSHDVPLANPAFSEFCKAPKGNYPGGDSGR